MEITVLCGWRCAKSIAAATEALGWETVNNVLTPLASTDFSSYIAPVLNSGADVLVLNHYGGNMVNSLTNAVQFGLREKQVNGKNFEIVVPLYSRLMARGAGENVKGIFGSTNWHWSLQDEGSKAFVKSFGQEYGFPPSQAAHTCYVQTLLYADAAQRAGTFDPCAIAAALEGFEFDGMGNGPTLYRAEARGLKPKDYLAAHDSYSLFSATGDLVVTGPTLTNVNDLRLILITPPKAF